jgi:hybrid cluster-associated redox disulfide protein
MSIEKSMTFEQILEANPKAGAILMRYGLHCIGCHISAYETLEQGSKAHGLSDEQIGKMVTELNQLSA